SAVVVEGAGQLVELAGDLGVGGGDDVPVLVLRDGQEAVHVLDLGAGHADGGCGLFVGVVAEVDVAHVGAHGGQAAQDAFDGGGVARGEQAGEVLERDAHLGDRGEQGASVLAVVAGGGHDVDDGGQGWDVPDHGQGAVLGVQGQRDLVLGDEVPDGGALGGRDPVVGDALGTRGGHDLGVVRVEEDGALGGQQVVLVLHARGFGDLVGVVQDEAEVAQASDAGLGAHGGQADLDAGVAQGAFLGLAGLVVEVDLLVGAAGDAHAPAAALVLVDQHD